MITMPAFMVPETLGLWSIPMLAAIPLLATAIIGWDPLYAYLDKSSYVSNGEDIQQSNWSSANLGVIDRGIRMGVGLAMLYALLTMTTMTAGMVLTLLAIPLIMSAIIAWDPVYALLGINSFASRTDVKAAELEPNDQVLAELYKCPEPAGNDRFIPQAA